MTYKEIVDLIKLINKTELTEVKIKDGDFKLSIRNKDFQSASSGNVEYTNAPIAYQPITAPPAIVQQVDSNDPNVAGDTGNVPDLKPTDEESEAGNLIEVKSPIVGTFYRSSSPDKPAYAKVGDVIEIGHVVCIVEAMKLLMK